MTKYLLLHQQLQQLTPDHWTHAGSLTCPNSKWSNWKLVASLLLIFLKFLSWSVERNWWVLLSTFQGSESAQGGVLISHWLVQRIPCASGSKMLTGNNTPLHEERQKRGIFVILLYICKSRKSAGEMSAVTIAVLNPNVFRYFTFFSCCRGRELLLSLVSNPNLMWWKSNSCFTAKISDVVRATVKPSSNSSFALSGPNCICYSLNWMQSLQLFFLLCTYDLFSVWFSNPWESWKSDKGYLHAVSDRWLKTKSECPSSACPWSQKLTKVKTSFTVSLKPCVLSHLNDRKISLYGNTNGVTIRTSNEEIPQLGVLSNLGFFFSCLALSQNTGLICNA